MSISGQTEELLEQKSQNKTTAPEETILTARQQQRQDALELAETIYDIYKDSLSNVIIVDENIKDDNNV